LVSPTTPNIKNEGIKLSIQKEEKEKFETKIVLENLKDFSEKIGETAPRGYESIERTCLSSSSVDFRAYMKNLIIHFILRITKILSREKIPP